MVELNDYLPVEVTVNGCHMKTSPLTSFYDLFVDACNLRSSLLRLQAEATKFRRGETRSLLVAFQNISKHFSAEFESAKSAVQLFTDITDGIFSWIAQQKLTEIDDKVFFCCILD